MDSNLYTAYWTSNGILAFIVRITAPFSFSILNLLLFARAKCGELCDWFVGVFQILFFNTSISWFIVDWLYGFAFDCLNEATKILLLFFSFIWLVGAALTVD